MQFQSSITFEVENNLSKPQIYLETDKIENILNNLFKGPKVKIDKKTGKKIFSTIFEPLKILDYSLDTKEKVFFNNEKASLIQGLILAYKNHFPITITPDMIWILILQGVSRFMEKYSNLVRERFVDFSGKKDLKIKKLEYSPYTATKEVWNGIIKEFTQKIEQNVGKEIISNLECNFSTTTQVSKVTSQVSIMSAMKQYFNYKLLMEGCGISAITLEGSVNDWEKIKSKLKFLSSKGFQWWTKHLIPIIDNIILTIKYYSKNKKINEQLINFWKGMIRVKGKGDMYDPHIINGWIIKFIPNLEGKLPSLYEEIKEADVPNQIIFCPMELTWLYIEGIKIDFNCSLASGFYGMIQDKKTFNVKPVIGYAIVVESEKEGDISVEEKNKILKEFFE